MRVIVTIEESSGGFAEWKTYNIRVRKCPPHEAMFGYETKSNEFICELEDYSDEDIRKYMEKEVTLTHTEAQQNFNEMANYLLTGKREGDG
tara:strand:+ start:731 stop:1003 length:273 start_codon:yes stop_codon:yes gene_type:complete